MKQGKYKFIVGLILLIILTNGGVYAVTTIAGSSITYSNTKSGLSSTNVQGAIDELYEHADIGKALRKTGNIVTAYTYSESLSNLCIMGDEETCQKTACYKNKTARSCPAGTIIKYKVNNADIVGFNVLVDNGNTMTMQSQRNINKSEWCSNDISISNTSGPLTALKAIEEATAGWTNVNDQTYSLDENTGCDSNLNCNTTYNLKNRTAKARMITVQEARNYIDRQFMTANREDSYWTSTAYTSYHAAAWSVNNDNSVTIPMIDENLGVRAVVEVTK